MIKEWCSAGGIPETTGMDSSCMTIVKCASSRRGACLSIFTKLWKDHGSALFDEMETVVRFAKRIESGWTWQPCRPSVCSLCGMICSLLKGRSHCSSSPFPGLSPMSRISRCPVMMRAARDCTMGIKRSCSPSNLRLRGERCARISSIAWSSMASRLIWVGRWSNPSYIHTMSTGRSPAREIHSRANLG
jgi:hypothetical protein